MLFSNSTPGHIVQRISFYIKSCTDVSADLLVKEKTGKRQMLFNMGMVQETMAQLHQEHYSKTKGTTHNTWINLPGIMQI